MSSQILRPKALKKNAVIGIVSPASPQRDEDFLVRGIRYLESLGYRVEIGKNALKRHNGYLAGTDDERRNDLEEMFGNPAIDAIFCARGGYGTMRFLRSLDYERIARNPKIFVGFSDITALQSALWRKIRLVTFSGAMPAVDMCDTFDDFSEEIFWRMLTSTHPLGRIYQPEIILPIHKGTARGRLFCGNLALFSALCGSEFLPHFRGGILLAEDIGEEPYRIDRMLAQLELSGAFRHLRGLAFGQFTAIPEGRSVTPQPPMESVLREYALRADIPSVGNILFGHQSKKLTLPFGAIAEINGEVGTFSLTTAGVV